MNIKFEVEKNALADIEKKLGEMSQKAPAIMKKAVNETAKKASKQLTKEAKKRYATKAADINKSTQIKNASVSNLEATIFSKGGKKELLDFKVSPGQYVTGNARPNVVKGKVLKTSGMKELQKDGVKAFVAKFNSGHEAVVERVPGKRMKKDPGKTFIRKLLTPSMPEMLGNEKSIKTMEPEAMEYLKQKVSEHIAEIMEG